MGSTKIQQGANAVADTINAILSVLDGITPFLENPAQLNATLNPYQYIMSLLHRVAGYERVVNFLSETMVYGLPMIEDAAKISLIKSLKDLFSCSVNPLISRDLIDKGVVLDLGKIDLLNIMNRCPLESENNTLINSSFFYSDVENMTIPDQLVKCKDLNAVIWYVKHRANDRTVWYGYQTQAQEHENLIISSKPSAKDGIITMEYTHKSKLTDSQNHPMYIQVPHGNCLHVFLGNTKGVSQQGTPEPSTEEILAKTTDFRNVMSEMETVIKELEILYDKTENLDEKSEIQCEIDLCNKLLDGMKKGVSLEEMVPNLLIDPDTHRRYLTIGDYRILMDEYTYTHNKNDIGTLYKELDNERQSRIQNYSYRAPEQNYYYHRTLFEFNTDYIMSVQFFDPKVIISQLVNILTGCFEFSLNISFEERLIRNEVERMINMIIESGGATVSDCFFTFSNDEYNIMLDETEKERVGKYTGDDTAYGSHIDYEAIYEELNQISSSATLSEQVSNTEHAMNTISRTIKPEFGDTTEWELNFNFLNNILRGLTLSLVYNIISPKIYMLMAINLKIMGREPNFDLATFIEMFKTLLINIIRGITDKIMENLKEWLLGLIGDLVARLADRLMFEQAQYYLNLLARCMRAYTIFFGAPENWNMADVEYADIYESGNGSEINTSC